MPRFAKSNRRLHLTLRRSAAGVAAPSSQRGEHCQTRSSRRPHPTASGAAGLGPGRPGGLVLPPRLRRWCAGRGRCVAGPLSSGASAERGCGPGRPRREAPLGSRRCGGRCRPCSGPGASPEEETKPGGGEAPLAQKRSAQSLEGNRLQTGPGRREEGTAKAAGDERDRRSQPRRRGRHSPASRAVVRDGERGRGLGDCCGGRELRWECSLGPPPSPPSLPPPDPPAPRQSSTLRVLRADAFPAFLTLEIGDEPSWQRMHNVLIGEWSSHREKG